jgi:hypothetical protein
MDKTVFESPDGMKVKGKIDPFLYLALVTNFEDFQRHSDGSFDCMVELEAEASAHLQLLTAIGLTNVPVESSIYSKDYPIAFYAGRLNETLLFVLCLLPNVVKRIQLAAPLIAPRAKLRQFSAAIGPVVNEQSYGSATLLALIDDGCPFAHPMLRRVDNGALRLRALWDQDRSPDFSSLGNLPVGFGYGVEVGRTALDKHIGKHTLIDLGYKSVDQDACYSSLNYQSAAKRVSHGAHSIGMILSGNKYVPDSAQQSGFVATHDGADLTADLLFVQLPRDVTAVPFHGARLRSILDGIRWVLDKSSDIEKNIVVAIPYGSMLGPHDGTSLFSKALDSLILRAGEKGKQLNVILAAGNEYEAKLHAYKEMPLKSYLDQRLTVRVAPESELPTFVEVWLPKKAKVVISVYDPNRQSVGLGNAFCSIVNTGWGGLKSEVTLIRIAPTTTQQPKQVNAKAGDWQIVLTGSEQAAGSVHSYISKARGGLESLLRGNQSRFVVPSGLTPKDIASGFNKGSLSDAITGEFVIGVGGYKLWQPVNNAKPAKYSSAGPAADGTHGPTSTAPNGPSVSMPCEQSPMLYGFRNAGNRAATTFRMNGTSAAASYYSARMGSSRPETTYPTTDADDALRLGTRHT